VLPWAAACMAAGLHLLRMMAAQYQRGPIALLTAISSKSKRAGATHSLPLYVRHSCVLSCLGYAERSLPFHQDRNKPVRPHNMPAWLQHCMHRLSWP
jgi:hypothetical protein